MVENLVFGCKDRFAVELGLENDKPNLVASSMLWLNNKYIGTLEDESSLLVVSNQLLSLCSKNIELSVESYENYYLIYDQIKYGNSENMGKHFLSLGDAYDDFSIVALKDGSSIIFLWEMVESPFFEYNSYPRGLQVEVLDFDDFFNVVNEFRNFCLKLECRKRNVSGPN